MYQCIRGISIDQYDSICPKLKLINYVLKINLSKQIDRYIAKKKAQILRDQQQVYDEFSPGGPVVDHGQYMYSDGQMYNGMVNLI